MFRLISTTEAPPGGFDAHVPATGAVWRGEDYHALVGKVEAHLKANKLTGSVERIIHETTARRLMAEGKPQFVEPVKQDDPRKRTIADYWAGTKLFAVLASKENSGNDPFVNPSEASRRGGICAACPHNTGPLKKQGWIDAWASGRMRAAIGGRSTAVDAKLGQCAICTCELRTAVWIEAEDLAATSPTHYVAQLPDFCWKKPILTK